MSAGMLGGRVTPLGLENAEALLDVLPRRLAAEDGAQALLQRPDVGLEEAGLQLGEERVHAQQRVRLAGVEPQAGQLVARAGAWNAEAVALRFGVVVDRRVEPRPHVLDVALYACRRHAKLVLEDRERNDFPVLQELVDLVEALQAIHGPPARRKSGSDPDLLFEALKEQRLKLGGELHEIRHLHRADRSAFVFNPVAAIMILGEGERERLRSSRGELQDLEDDPAMSCARRPVAGAT